MKTNYLTKVATILFLPLFIFCSLSIAQNVLPGTDGMITPAGGGTFVAIPPLPNNFFYPGSDPFTGTVVLKGAPLSTAPAGALGLTDVLVRRMAVAPLGGCPSAAPPIPIEIIALHLVSVAPITVTAGGGGGPNPWNVEVYVSEVNPQTQGTMVINKTHMDGGTFDSNLPVLPRFIFTSASHPTVVYDPPGAMPMNLSATGSCWLYGCPNCPAIAIPPGVLVDGDGNGTINVPVPPSSNFYPNITDDATCGTPGSVYSFCTAIEQHPVGAQHTVKSPLSSSQIPTLPQWGLIILGMLLLLAGVVYSRRRRMAV